jgi:vancomycin resistance protein YoaR
MITIVNKSFVIKLFLIQILCGTLSLSLGLKYGISSHLSKYTDKIYDNLMIEGINVNSLTREQAFKRIEAQYIDTIMEKQITLTLDTQLFKASLKTFIKDSNLDEVVNEVYSYPNHLSTVEKWLFLLKDQPENFDIRFDFDQASIELFAEHIIAQVNRRSQDAAITIDSQGSIAISPHANGYIVDKEKLVAQISNSLMSYSDELINLSDFVTESSPMNTTALLESIDTCIASYSTTFSPDTGKAINIALSAESINGTLLLPGDVFSFNKAIGETTLDKGYTYGPVIINSRVAEGLGGGICQTSSTLYNAIINTGLSSLSRRPHSKPVGYVPLGLDATVSWDSIDYQFKNTLDYPIYIQAYTEGNALTVNIYSNHVLKNRSYKVKSEVYQVLPASARYAYAGYKVKVIREVYEKNRLKDTEVISMDTYLPS